MYSSQAYCNNLSDFYVLRHKAQRYIKIFQTGRLLISNRSSHILSSTSQGAPIELEKISPLPPFRRQSINFCPAVQTSLARQKQSKSISRSHGRTITDWLSNQEVEDRAKRRTCQNFIGLYGSNGEDRAYSSTCRLSLSLPLALWTALPSPLSVHDVATSSTYGGVVPGYPGGHEGHRAKALLTPPPCRWGTPHLDGLYIP